MYKCQAELWDCGQFLKSGDPFFSHPLAFAKFLAKLAARDRAQLVMIAYETGVAVARRV